MINNRSLYDELDHRLQLLIDKDIFEDEAFMLYLGKFAPALLYWILDLRYGPEYDKTYIKGDLAFDGRRNKRGE